MSKTAPQIANKAVNTGSLTLHMSGELLASPFTLTVPPNTTHPELLDMIMPHLRDQSLSQKNIRITNDDGNPRFIDRMIDGDEYLVKELEPWERIKIEKARGRQKKQRENKKVAKLSDKLGAMMTDGEDKDGEDGGEEDVEMGGM